MKLSVNEAKLTGLCMGKELCYYSTGLDFKIAFGPKSFQDFRETGPWPLRNYMSSLHRLELQQKRFLKIHFGLQMSF